MYIGTSILKLCIFLRVIVYNIFQYNISHVLSTSVLFLRRPCINLSSSLLASFFGNCLWIILFLQRSATNYPTSLWTSRLVVHDANCIDDWSLLLCTWSWWKDPWKAEKIIALSANSWHCHANPPRAALRKTTLGTSGCKAVFTDSDE